MSKLLIHLLIIVLLSPSVLVFAAYYPSPLFGQTSAYVSSKLYIFGGTILNIDNLPSYNHDIFYLDLSNRFDTTSTYPWNNDTISLNNSHIYASACVGGALNDNVFVFDSFPEFMNNSDGTSTPLIYMYSSQQKSIGTPLLNTVESAPRRRGVQAICDKQGKMYVFGGIDDFTGNGVGSTIFNRMDIFNTIELLYGWSSGAALSGGIYGYAAVLLNDNDKIVYIGGRTVGGQYVRMNDIYVYSTTANTWSTQSAGGNVPGSRDGHSAVITTDNRIIIYGGSKADPLLAILIVGDNNINSHSFTWSTPTVKNQIPGLYSHSANLIRDSYMFVTFGYLESTDRRNSDVYILDTSNPKEYSWITTFNPPDLPEISKILTPDDIAKNSIRFWTLGSIIGCVSAFVLSAFIILYCRHSNKYGINKPHKRCC